MPERMAEASARFKARMAGVCQLLEALTATFGQVIVRDRLVVARWRRRGYSGQYPGSRAVVLVGIRILAHRSCVPHRVGGSHV